jgi:hypothetical protein
MRDGLQLVQNIEGAHVCDALLAPPPAANADRISILFFRASSSGLFYSHSHHSPHFPYLTAAFRVGVEESRLFGVSSSHVVWRVHVCFIQFHLLVFHSFVILFHLFPLLLILFP